MLGRGVVLALILGERRQVAQNADRLIEWRELPEWFGNWNTIYRNFDWWAKDGVWARLLEHVQGVAERRGDIDWAASIDSTIACVHQHGATLPRVKKGHVELQQDPR